MADRHRSEILRSNEQIKALAGVWTNIGTATLGAFAARFIVKDGIDLVGAGWFVGALVSIWVGSKLLTLLESEV